MPIVEDTTYLFATRITPIITLTLFVLGVGYRIYLWIRSGRSGGVYRVNLLATVKEFTLNSIFLGRIFRPSKTLWIVAQ